MNGKTISKKKHIKKSFICPLPDCGKPFKTKFSLNRHSLVHDAEKRCVCPVCSKKFTLPQNLKEHMNTHTQEKPFVCGVGGCKQRFRQSGKLSLHRRTHPEYKMKKYHLGAPESMKVTLKLKCAMSSNQDEEKHNHPCIDDFSFQKPDPVVKKRVLEKQDSNNADGRDYFRQDSGKTVASAPGADELPDFRTALNPPIQKDASEYFGKLTKSALEVHDALMNKGAPQANEKPDSFLESYLDLLPTAFSSTLRPVLPIPPQIQASMAQKSVAPTAPNLFELIQRYTTN